MTNEELDNALLDARLTKARQQKAASVVQAPAAEAPAPEPTEEQPMGWDADGISRFAKGIKDVAQDSFGDIVPALATNLPFGGSAKLAEWAAPEGTDPKSALAALRDTRANIAEESPVQNLVGIAAPSTAGAIATGGASIPMQMAVGAGFSGASNLTKQAVEQGMDPSQEYSGWELAGETALGGLAPGLPGAIKGVGNASIKKALSVAGIPREAFDIWISGNKKAISEMPANLVRKIQEVVSSAEGKTAADTAAHAAEMEATQAGYATTKAATKDLGANATAMRQQLLDQDKALVDAQKGATLPLEPVAPEHTLENVSTQALDAVDNLSKQIGELGQQRAALLQELPDDPVHFANVVARAERELAADPNAPKDLLADVTTYPEFKQRMQEYAGQVFTSNKSASNNAYRILLDTEDTLLQKSPNYRNIKNSTAQMRDLYQIRNEVQDKYRIPSLSGNRYEQNLADVQERLSGGTAGRFVPAQEEMFNFNPATSDLMANTKGYVEARARVPTPAPFDENAVASQMAPGYNALAVAEDQVAGSASKEAELLAKLEQLKASVPQPASFEGQTVENTVGQVNRLGATNRGAYAGEELAKKAEQDITNTLSSGGYKDAEILDMIKQARTAGIMSGSADVPTPNAKANFLMNRLNKGTLATGINATSKVAGGLYQASTPIGYATRGALSVGISHRDSDPNSSTEKTARNRQVVTDYIMQKFPEKFNPDMSESEQNSTASELAFTEASVNPEIRKFTNGKN
jgi:hypothetical protein